jgi:hypothetical protein
MGLYFCEEMDKAAELAVLLAKEHQEKKQCKKQQGRDGLATSTLKNL